jgi:murein DD-endopeptidase MepM/ murein hydrolase activator NlpD
LAGIGGKRRTRTLLVFVLLLAGGCASQTTISKPRLNGVYHTVTAGETLFRIGKAYGTSYQELARVNGIKDAAQIRVGQRIFIPGAAHPIPVETITPTEIAPAAPASPERTPGFETFLWPVQGTINSGFGPRGMSFHDGIDIAAPEGTPINAIEDGEVIYSNQLRGYGNMVILRHAGGIVSVYAHNESNLVREGQTVARGEVVATVGSTGRVSGPHLHFEIRKNNAAQDPLRYLPQLCCVTASDNLAPKN